MSANTFAPSATFSIINIAPKAIPNPLNKSTNILRIVLTTGLLIRIKVNPIAIGPDKIIVSKIIPTSRASDSTMAILANCSATLRTHPYQ